MKFGRYSLGIALATTFLSGAALAEDLVVYQDWSSPAEVKALNVLKSAATKKGINWIDITIPHDTGSNVTLLNLVTGGNPPNVFSENNPAVYMDLEKMGLGRTLTRLFSDLGAVEHFPSVVRKVITINGEIRKIPLGIQVDGMIYYNKDVAAKAGVNPEKWTSLDAMYADFAKVKAAGFVPAAFGAQQWQIGYLTHSLVATLGGADYFTDIYGPKPKRAALDSPVLRDVFTWLRKFQQASDPGAVNRDWNMTTNTVISGQALMQIHGDWMKGEWKSAGKVPGKDFGCLQIPGSKAVVVSVDSWGLLGGQAAAKDKAEADFASAVVDPVVNAEFAAAKGATPVRADAPTDKLDSCTRDVLEILKDPARQVQNPHSMVDPDWQASIWEVAFSFWSKPSTTVDQAIAAIQKNYDTIVK